MSYCIKWVITTFVFFLNIKDINYTQGDNSKEALFKKA